MGGLASATRIGTVGIKFWSPAKGSKAILLSDISKKNTLRSVRSARLMHLTLEL